MDMANLKDNQQQPIPPSFENWISEWLKKNVVSSPEDWQMHNAKVTWCRAIAIDAYRKLSTLIETLEEKNAELKRYYEDKISKLSQQQTPGMRWVGIEEGLPEIGKSVEVVTEFMNKGKPATEIFIGYVGEDGELYSLPVDDNYGWPFKECVAFWRYVQEFPTPSAPPIPTEEDYKRLCWIALRMGAIGNGSTVEEQQKAFNHWWEDTAKILLNEVPLSPNPNYDDPVPPIRTDDPIEEEDSLQEQLQLAHDAGMSQADGDRQNKPKPSLDLSDKQMPEEIKDWIEEQIAFFSVPAAKVAGKAMAIDMYQKMREEVDILSGKYVSVNNTLSIQSGQLAAARQEAADYRKALKYIANPVAEIQKAAKEKGCIVDGQMAVNLSHDPNHLSTEAVIVLSKYPSPTNLQP